jgi:hypothetical protein
MKPKWIWIIYELDDEETFQPTHLIFKTYQAAKEECESLSLAHPNCTFQVQATKL